MTFELQIMGFCDGGWWAEWPVFTHRLTHIGHLTSESIPCTVALAHFHLPCSRINTICPEWQNATPTHTHTIAFGHFVNNSRQLQSKRTFSNQIHFIFLIEKMEEKQNLFKIGLWALWSNNTDLRVCVCVEYSGCDCCVAQIWFENVNSVALWAIFEFFLCAAKYLTAGQEQKREWDEKKMRCNIT